MHSVTMAHKHTKMYTADCIFVLVFFQEELEIVACYYSTGETPFIAELSSTLSDYHMSPCIVVDDPIHENFL